ncbi:hypothetical protein KXX52_009296 [Aspergillus fumigatus]|nr:hypothetical protein KXX52_009296 [Aspergillus fumigatus]
MVGQGKGRIDSAEANQAGEQHQPQIVVVPDAVENLTKEAAVGFRAAMNTYVAEPAPVVRTGDHARLT